MEYSEFDFGCQQEKLHPLAEVLKKDTDFLKEHERMDYSVVFSVHSKPMTKAQIVKRVSRNSGSRLVQAAISETPDPRSLPVGLSLAVGNAHADHGGEFHRASVALIDYLKVYTSE